MDAPSAPISRRPWVRTLVRYHRLCVAVAFVAALAVIWTSLLLPRRYAVELPFTLQVDPALAQVNDTHVQQQLAQSLRSAVEVLTASAPDAGLTLRDTTRPGSVPTLIASHTSDDPAVPPSVLGQLPDLYAARTQPALRAALADADERLRRAMGEQRAAVAQLAHRQQQFVADEPLFSVERAGEASTNIPALTQQLAHAQATLATMKTELDQTPGTDKALAQLQAQRGILARDMEVHLNQWGRSQDHPLVLKTQSRLDELDKQIAQAQQQARDAQPQRAKKLAAIRQAEREVAAWQVKLDREQRLLAMAGQYHENEAKLTTAAADLRRAEATLAGVEAAIAGGGNWVQLKPSAPLPQLASPITPKPAWIALAAALAATLAGGATAAMAVRCDRTLVTTQQFMQTINLPVLGMVDQAIAPDQPRRAGTLKKVVYPPAGLAMAAALLMSFSLVCDSIRAPASSEGPGISMPGYTPSSQALSLSSPSPKPPTPSP